MGRPTKQGIDYFPLDVQFDEKVELLIAAHGAEGLGILITIWQLIYQNEGYFIKNGENLYLLIRRRVMSEVQTIKNVVETALKLDIFDKEKHEKFQILTSKSIQERYFLAAKRKRSVRVYQDYIIDIRVFEDGNYQAMGLNVDKNATKEKEEEKEKEKEKEDKGSSTVAKTQTVPTYNDLVEEFFNNIPKDLDHALKIAYPNIDHQAEYLKAKAWLIANKSRPKKDFPKFLHNWMAKAMRFSPIKQRAPDYYEKKAQAIKRFYYLRSQEKNKNLTDRNILGYMRDYEGYPHKLLEEVIEELGGRSKLSGFEKTEAS